MAAKKKRNYCIYTLNANEMADLYRVQDGCFDLNSAYIRSMIVHSDDDLYSDSALFDQIMFTLDGRLGRTAESRDLTGHLVYLLFEYGIRDEEKAKALFEDGFKIIFEGQSEVRSFCSFDKSASMSRENTISFIDTELFDEVDRRISLDIDFTEIPLTPSKYYAYRGLAMTEGTPVTVPELRLDEETVLVLPDSKVPTDYVSQIRNSKKVSDTRMIAIDAACTKPKVDRLEVTPYDGEGLISPEYAGLVRSELFYLKDITPTSFQIRMPYTKGMLHEVDFRLFLTEQFPDENIDELWIEDVFGRKRCLKDVRIILNASMFKAWRWLKDWVKDGDPLKYYFDKFWKYNHCLYVVNTNASIRDTGKITFNYQFLNSLDIDRKEFDDLVREYSDEIQEARKDAKKARDALMQNDLIDEGDPEIVDRNYLREMSAWEYAVSTNLAFMNDPMTKRELGKLEDSRIASIMRGRITVEGLMRYLSGDLFAMLIQIAEGCGLKGNQKFKELKSRRLHADKFYMPQSERFQLVKGHYYGVLRSPHLSRNEQCAIRPCPGGKTRKLYNRYFKQLTGVIMVSNLSIVPTVLAGADFDGDLVKVVLNEPINQAILRGVYEKAPRKGTDEPEYIRYKRRLPVAFINAPGGDRDIKVGRHISIEHAKASFSNRVGHISNLAITLGELEYNGTDIPEGTTALCTIATGLELDAVKTGVRPDLSYFEKTIETNRKKQKRRKKIGPQFIDALKSYMEFVKENPFTPIYGAIDGDEYRAYYKSKQSGKEEIIPVFAARNVGDANIERLPILFVEALVKKRVSRRKAFKDLPKQQFRFENFKDWRANALKDDRATELKAIIKDYYMQRRTGFFSNVNKKKRKMRLAVIAGCIHTLLSTEYDLETDRLYHTGVAIRDLFDQTAIELVKSFRSSEDIYQAILKMRELRWQFAPTYEKRQAVLEQILDTSGLSEAVREFLCATCDNGYQFLNFFLQYAQILKREEEQEEKYGGESKLKRSYTDEKALEKVRKLFGKEMQQAIECTVALDERRVFLWNVFEMEDLVEVIDDGVIRRKIHAE